MEATSVLTAGTARARRVSFGGAQIGLLIVGAVVAIIGLFLKGFTVPSDIVYTGKTTYISASGAPILLGAVAVALVFLALAVALHRRGLLWGTYVFTLLAIAIAAINAFGGFTLTLANGGSRSANAAIGVFVTLAGTVIMLIGAIAVRQSATPTR